MKLNRKLWTAALAVAMTTPSAMAAQDTAGMHYTSAAEGFYASIRLRYVSNGGDKDGGSDIQNSSSRFGVRGTNDLGGGLEGFYQYEAGVETENNGGLSTRVGVVGLRGDFGEVAAGSFWTNSYNWVYGSTDIANRHSGAFAYGEFGQGRSKNSIQYSTPDLNGFRGAVLLKADSSVDGQSHGDEDGRGVGKGGNTKDDNDIDHWSLAASYDIAGFSMGLSYSVYPDAIAGLQYKNRNLPYDVAEAMGYVNAATVLVAIGVAKPLIPAQTSTLDMRTSIDRAKKDDLTAWAFKLGYSQDNWYVNGWYGEESTGDIGGYTLHDNKGTADTADDVSIGGKFGDNEVFSLAGGISVDKVAVYAVYENKESDMLVGETGKKKHIRGDDANYTLGVQYTLGSNSWTWVEYAGRDHDSSTSEDDDFSIGLGHSF